MPELTQQETPPTNEIVSREGLKEALELQRLDSSQIGADKIIYFGTSVTAIDYDKVNKEIKIVDAPSMSIAKFNLLFPNRVPNEDYIQQFTILDEPSQSNPFTFLDTETNIDDSINILKRVISLPSGDRIIIIRTRMN